MLNDVERKLRPALFRPTRLCSIVQHFVEQQMLQDVEPCVIGLTEINACILIKASRVP